MLFLLGASVVFGQNPSFEVASIKPAAQPTGGRFFSGVRGDPGRVEYRYVSLWGVVIDAYGIKEYQLSGPEWMKTARFDIQAKMPPETSKADRNLMLQSLLAERFHLKVHKESKEEPQYSLIVARNGPKLKKAEEAPANGVGGPPNGGGRAPRWDMTLSQEGPGKFHMWAREMTMPGLAEWLSHDVRRPVLDNTGLAGRYEIDLEFAPEDRQTMPRPDSGDARGPAPDGVEAPSIFTALQERLGLKLEAKKGPIETIVVDQADKTPTGN